MIKELLLAAITVIIIVVSRKVLFRPDTHGFYRFFAWELTAVLLYLNVNHWFKDPLNPLQLASWLLLMLSLLTLILSVTSLKSIGKPESTAKDATRLGIEKTTVLVTVGIYRYIRHPLYDSVLFLAWGAALKTSTWPSIVLAVVVTGLVVATARVEETENVKLFGQGYLQYMMNTKMFVPFLI